MTALASRAVKRQVEPGMHDHCAHCRERIMFRKWRGLGRKVVANVYVDGRWDRVEHFHADCYVVAGEPYGPAA